MPSGFGFDDKGVGVMIVRQFQHFPPQDAQIDFRKGCVCIQVMTEHGGMKCCAG